MNVPPIFSSLQFWTLLVGVIAYVAKFYFPELPLDNQSILALVLFVLGLVGVTPQVRRLGLRPSLTTTAVYNSLAFWQLVAGLVAFVVTYFAPQFPFDQDAIFAAIVFVLGLLGVVPELRERHLIL